MFTRIFSGSENKSVIKLKKVWFNGTTLFLVIIMILNTGSRTDIPAYYSEWFMNRIHEGFVLARNPYYPKQVYRYQLDPGSVDILAFCTKNPQPMLEHLDELKDFRQLWYVTLTSYGRDIEPNVPDKHHTIEAIQKLAKKVGRDSVILRYDPVFLSEKYSKGYHRRAFYKIAKMLQGYVSRIVISYIDLYEKTKKNFPEVREVSWQDQVELTQYFAYAAAYFGMRVYTCLEDPRLAAYGVNTSGCMSEELLEETLGIELNVPKLTPAREGCSCLLGNDIGAYNTCAHFCRYCYANYDQELVLRNMKDHDPKSPLLIGHLQKDDVVKDVKQVSWLDPQLKLVL